MEKKQTIRERLDALMGMSRTYNRMSAYTDNELSKTWNGGMGNQKFIEVSETDGVVYYNTLLTYKRDLARVKEVFPEYDLVAVDLPYWSHSSLRYHYKEAQRLNQPKQ